MYIHARACIYRIGLAECSNPVTSGRLYVNWDGRLEHPSDRKQRSEIVAQLKKRDRGLQCL